MEQGRQGAQHPQCISQHRSRSCIISRSQREKQICTNMPVCEAEQLRKGHIFAATCDLLSRQLPAISWVAIALSDKKCRKKKKGSGKETKTILKNSLVEFFFSCGGGKIMDYILLH